MANNPQIFCDIILHSVRASRLTYTLQETPYSLYLTLRKRFIKPDKNNPEAEFLKPCQHFSNLNMKSEKIYFDFENIVKANKSLEESFQRLKFDHEEALNEIETKNKVIEQLEHKVEILNAKVAEATTKLEADTINLLSDKDSLATKHETFVLENKSQVEEIEELKSELNNRNKTLNILKDDKRDIDLNKKVELLETKIKDANETQAKEEREFKSKIKKSNKNLKDATEKEEKLKVEKAEFERSKETLSRRASQDLPRLGNPLPSYIPDLAPFPSMVAHWLPPHPPE